MSRVHFTRLCSYSQTQIGTGLSAASSDMRYESYGHKVVAVALCWMSVARLWATTCQAAEGYAANLRFAAGATHSHVCSVKLHLEIWSYSLSEGTIDAQNWRSRRCVYCSKEASPL